MIYKGFLTATCVALTKIYPGLVGDPKKIGGVGSMGGLARLEGKKRSSGVRNTKLGGGTKKFLCAWGVGGTGGRHILNVCRLGLLGLDGHGPRLGRLQLDQLGFDRLGFAWACQLC
jgi:hypothetical protein